MAENFIEYRYIKTQAEKFLEAVNQFKAESKPENMPQQLWQAQLDACESMYQELIKEANEYEKKHINPSTKLPDIADIKMRVGAADGMVAIDFGGTLSFMGLPPDEAIRFGEKIIEVARTIPRLH